MSRSLVKMTVTGRLGKDAELVADGRALEFSLAVNLPPTKKGGAETTTWIKVTKWGAGVEKLVDYLTKGTQVVVIGSPQITTFTYTKGAKEGQTALDWRITCDYDGLSMFGGGERHEAAEDTTGDDDF